MFPQRFPIVVPNEDFPPMSASDYGREVAVVRTMRDGSVTREHWPEYLAELTVAMIPFSEPQVASARIAYSELTG